MESPPDTADERSTEEPKSLETIFRELLREKNVGSNASWEYALKLIGNDYRFELFRHHPERKQMFNAYKTQKAKEEREEQRLKAKRAKENLEKFLQTSDKMRSNVKYRQAAELFRDNEYWKAVPEIDRREIFEDVIVFLTNNEKEESKKLQKRNMRVLSDILDSMPTITFRTTWQEAQQLLLDNPIFAEDADLLGMDKEDALIVFEEHIRQLEQEEEEERKRENKRMVRQARKNREYFVQFLDELHSQGKLTSISKWCNLYHEISADPRFTAMLSQPFSGSTPLDLFKFYVEDLKARYEDEKQIIRDLLKASKFQVGIGTTYEEFAAVLSEDERSVSLDAGNVKMVFERLMNKAMEKEKERLREESKQRRKLEIAFMNLLAKIEPSIEDESDWERVRKTIGEEELYLQLSESERIQFFRNYIHTLEESCSHHHSKSKKQKKDKDKRLKREKKRSHSSSSDSSEHHRHLHSSRNSTSYRKRRGRSLSRSRSCSKSRSRSFSCSRSISRSRSRSRSLSTPSSRYKSKSRSKSSGRTPSKSRSQSRSPSRSSSRSGSRGGSPFDRSSRKKQKNRKRRNSSESDDVRVVAKPLPPPITENPDDLEELEKQRRLLLQQLAAHQPI